MIQLLHLTAKEIFSSNPRQPSTHTIHFFVVGKYIFATTAPIHILLIWTNRKMLSFQCDQIWWNLENFGKKLAILLSSLSFWKHLEPLWVKKSCLRAYFHYCKWPNIEKNNLAIWSHCASAANANKTTRNCYSVSTELNKIQDVISSLPTLFKDQLYSHSCVWTKTRGCNINVKPVL